MSHAITGAPAAASRRWWRRPWIAPLFVLVVMFIAFSLPPYLTFDPRLSRVPPPAEFPLHYPLLVAHVLFGSIAMLTCCVQIWPWFRRRYPAAHRTIGRVYVFGGVFPAGVSALIIGARGPFGITLRVSDVLLAILWLTCTAAGLRMAWRRRFVEHRRWMVRSFTLTLSIITNRFWAALFIVAVGPELFTPVAGNDAMTTQTIAGLVGWLGWVLPLLFAEWWLVERGGAAARGAAAAIG